MIVTGWLLIVLGIGEHGPVWSEKQVSDYQTCIVQRDGLREEAKAVRAIVSIVCEPVLKRNGRSA